MSVLTEAEEAVIEDGNGMLSIPDATGDTRVMWDPRIPEEVEAAKASFDAARAKGMLAYGVKKNGDPKREVIREFDADLGKIIMVKPIQGG